MKEKPLQCDLNHLWTLTRNPGFPRPPTCNPWRSGWGILHEYSRGRGGILFPSIISIILWQLSAKISSVQLRKPSRNRSRTRSGHYWRWNYNDTWWQAQRQWRESKGPHVTTKVDFGHMHTKNCRKNQSRPPQPANQWRNPIHEGPCTHRQIPRIQANWKNLAWLDCLKMEAQGTSYSIAWPQRLFYYNLQLPGGQISHIWRWNVLFQLFWSIPKRMERNIQPRQGRLQLGSNMDSNVFPPCGILERGDTKGYRQ